MASRVELNHFVFRQTPESRFSHFEAQGKDAADTWAALAALIEGNFAASVQDDGTSPVGDRTVRQSLREDGKIIKLTLPSSACAGFFSGVVAVDASTQLKSFFAPRAQAQPGEQSFIQTVAVDARKAPAKHVEVILYHRDALTLDERTYTPAGSKQPVVQDGQWQVVSINARATSEPEPATPQAMARNMAASLGLPEGVGGTAREYTAGDFMRAILYWSQHAMADGS